MATLAEALERALQLHERGRLDEAEALYRRILVHAPDHAETLHLLGALAHQRGQHEAAIALIGKSIARDGRAAVAHNSLGVAYHALARLDEATASYRRALALDPRFAEAWSNLGNTLHQQGDFKGAEDSYRRALAIAPETAEIHNNFGTTLYDQGDFKGAEEHYRQALRLRPDYPDAHFHLAGIHLRRGDFAVGWREYEWRWRMKRFVMPARPFKQPQWHGEPLNGARILIHAEQGFGDSLQFIRYVPLVAERGGKVVLEVPRELLRLFAGIAGAESVVAYGTAPADFAWHCPLMSLPFAFGTTLADIPARIPYIGVDPAAVAQWRQRVEARPGLRVGLVWAGRRSWKQHYERAFPAAALVTLTKIAGVSWFSLQKGAAPPPGTAITDFAPDLADFADTAAAIAALDLIVTIDSAVAHLAGALGKPVWILLPAVADWRWLDERADSPWYPTARLFRQESPLVWDAPLGCLAAELARVAAGEHGLLPPIL
ncbi:MAG TPA: tetratricopeptide repeat protein [Stellaceae bacterium]|nr:tetratricopeptide repeat protein [Stellaceae bacterium]